MKNLEKGINIFINIVFYVSLIALVFWAFGVRYYNVLSASMEPTIPVGSLIVVWPTSFDNVKDGDVVTAQLNTGILLTHRAVEVDHDQRHIITKGDNNATRDAQPIRADQVVGTVAFHIPMLGGAIDFIKSTAGITLIASVIIAWVVLKRFVLNK